MVCYSCVNTQMMNAKLSTTTEVSDSLVTLLLNCHIVQLAPALHDTICILLHSQKLTLPQVLLRLLLSENPARNLFLFFGFIITWKVRERDCLKKGQTNQNQLVSNQHQILYNSHERN